MMKEKKHKGAQIGNTNAVKSGKYSERDFLTCGLCSVTTRCDHFDFSDQSRVCFFEKSVEKPHLESLADIIELLKEMIKTDWLRFNRGVSDERIRHSGVIQVDVIKLGSHIKNCCFTIGKLIEIQQGKQQP